jgi:hypothetical protein
MVRLPLSRLSDGSRTFLRKMKAVAERTTEDLTLSTVTTRHIQRVLSMTDK